MDLLDFLCINCETFIPVKRIEVHSSLCTLPFNALSLQKSSDIVQIDFRLEKVHLALESKLQINDSILSPEQFLFLEFLSRKALSVLSIKSYNSKTLEICSEVQKDLEKNQFHFDQDPLILLYSERLKYLIIQKLRLIQRILDSSKKSHRKSLSLDTSIKINDLVLEKLNKEIESYRSLHRHYEKKCEILEVNSTFELTARSSFNSSRTELSEIFEEITLQNEEDLKKVFYGKCLVAKLGFSSRDPRQLIQIPKLYELAKSKGLGQQDWDDFIRIEFS